MAVHYRPVLPAGRAELDALVDIEGATVRRMTPIVELAPAGGESARDAARRLQLDLAVRWRPGLQLGVDVPDQVGDRPVALAYLVMVADDVVRGALPVLRPGDGAVLDELARLAVPVPAAVVRLRTAQLRLPVALRDAAVAELLHAARLDRSAVDLVVDLGPLPARVLPGPLRAAVLGVLGSAGWRSRTLLSGAFPRFLPRAREDWEPVEIPRRDEQLWRQVRAELGGAVDYGDYAAAHPVPTVGGRAATPHLRYAVQGRWLVLRGRRYRAEQFFEVCQRIGAHPEFTERLGTADEALARRAREGPARGLTCGNSTIWKQLSTARHLDFVVRHLDG